MEKKFNFVYLTTNLINGKQYIGERSCNDIKKDKYLGSGRLFLKKKREYGVNNFKRQILEYFDTKQEAFDAQQKYIEQYNTLVPNGYNLSPKGGLNVIGCLSEEARLKISIKSAQRKYTKEQREKMSLSHKGKKLSDEHIKNRSISQTGIQRSEETKNRMRIAAKGKQLTEEHKQNLSKSLKGKQLTEEHKQNLSKSLKGKQLTEKQLEARKNIKKKLCIYCQKEFKPGVFKRFHGNNCKIKI